MKRCPDASGNYYDDARSFCLEDGTLLAAIRAERILQQCCIRSQPDASAWVAVLDSSGDFRGMIDGFMNSLEYRARFGP